MKIVLNGFCGNKSDLIPFCKPMIGLEISSSLHWLQ